MWSFRPHKAKLLAKRDFRPMNASGLKGQRSDRTSFADAMNKLDRAFCSRDCHSFALRQLGCFGCAGPNVRRKGRPACGTSP
jgi:hypothetical protein